MQSTFHIGQLVGLSEGAADREKGRTYCVVNIVGSVALTSRGTIGSASADLNSYHILWLDRLMQQSP